MMNRVRSCVLAFSAVLLSGCSGYNVILKSTDYDAKYELGKNLYVEGKYSNASSILEDCVMMLRGTSKGEESVYLLASCYYQLNDWVMASQYYQNYYKTYSKGLYAEEARFRSGRALYQDTPDPRLDPTSTYGAITELQQFLELYPGSRYADEANEMITPCTTVWWRRRWGQQPSTTIWATIWVTTIRPALSPHRTR